MWMCGWEQEQGAEERGGVERNTETKNTCTNTHSSFGISACACACLPVGVCAPTLFILNEELPVSSRHQLDLI